jgi:hypothetical protein
MVSVTCPHYLLEKEKNHPVNEKHAKNELASKVESDCTAGASNRIQGNWLTANRE